jgi:hypothetical protein
VSGAGVRSYGQCYQNLFSANGDQGRILWSTEFGVSGAKIVNDWGPKTSVALDSIHRNWWRDALSIASTHKHYQKMIGYQLVANEDGVVPTDGGNPEDYGFGLIRPGGTWKPAASWLQGSGYNSHILQYSTAAGWVTVYAPGKRPIGYSYSRNGGYVTFHVVVDKAAPKVVAFEPEPTPPPSVTISGTSEMQAYSWCQWSAPASGGTPPYSYAWTVDGQPAGDDSDMFTHAAGSSSFTIAVTVTDAGGRVTSDDHEVAIVSGAYCM